MSTARTVLIGALLGLLSMLCALAPASATTESTPRSMSVEAGPGEPLIVVEGESWSSPAYPVFCRYSSGQVACTPTTASEVKPQQCFVDVLMNGASTTVCTTYEGHAAALQQAGGKNLIVKYGCSVGDVVCTTFENAGRGMAIASTTAMLLVASSLRFDTSTVLWTAAATEWSFWQWAVLVITFAAMAWSVAAAVISGERDELVSAVVRTFLAIPAVPLTLWMTGHLLNAVDDLTWYILNRDGPATLFTTLQKVTWAGGEANYFFAFLIHGLLLLSMLLLVLVFTFRNIALAALVTAGPVAWMLFPLRTIGPQWVVRYVSAVVSLLLAGPLTIGFLTLIVNGLAEVETIWDPQAWPLLIGLVLAAFAPFAVFGLFTFLGGVAADRIGSRIGGHAARAGSNAARSAARMPSRLGAHPAGVPRGPARSTPTTPRTGTGGPGGPRKPASTPPPRSTSGSTPPRSQATSAPPPPPSSTSPASPPRPERSRQ
ncbi:MULTISPECIES: hypothetical protein [unclassified Microbacterium]|uniref:hypothetical protein n=1 Tax=unclassified Microbacterium TaxID=2609290 RepID=UPI00313896C7